MSMITAKRSIGACLVALALATGAGHALADDTRSPAQYGPGMMGGYGPGMMGGYGPGMMGGYGPGMMGGYGPGMMGGYGPGMMGGYGPGMMGGYYGPALSADQRKAINAIQDDVRKQHWSMMGAMMDEQAKLRDLYQSGKPDQAAIAEAYKHIGEIQRAMFQSMIEARQKIDAVLSGKQK